MYILQSTDGEDGAKLRGYVSELTGNEDLCYLKLYTGPTHLRNCYFTIPAGFCKQVKAFKGNLAANFSTERYVS
jgi:hypothetical protein